jgi:deoxyribodipyrimidine photo-lyase
MSVLFWFRRDLRDDDNAGLSHAMAFSGRVFCAFVFDTDILDHLPARADRRVEFIWHSVAELKQSLEKQGGGLAVLHGSARKLIPDLARRLGVETVIANRDYEPFADERDAAVETSLKREGIAFALFKDQVIFERREILTQAGKPFTVFTPYRNAWLKQLEPDHYRHFPAALGSFAPPPERLPMPTLVELGFEPTNLLDLGIEAGMSGAQRRLSDFLTRLSQYARLRDYPGLRGVSYLSVHLRFGTLSIRELVRIALAHDDEGSRSWLNELVWRDFYFQILSNFPHVVTRAFKAEYDSLTFENDLQLFKAWQEGRTGYPIVDAAMRQLARTGFMHNRLRMIAASFLVKDLQIDWRWGERHFAEQLNDYDLAANNGGWQWSASTGCDAQPWFRIFNPVTQSERFDSQGLFILRYVPELARVPAHRIHAPWKMSLEEQERAGCIIGRNYPSPIVDHGLARQKTLQRYQR